MRGARALTSSALMARHWWPSRATSVRKRARTVCGALNVSRPPRPSESPAHAGGMISTLLAWNGKSVCLYLQRHVMRNMCVICENTS